MTSLLFFALLAMLLVGAALILLGRRGRKINNHPQCRWCGFDLDGVYPASVTCPECGAGLKRDGAVRIGVRKRIPALMAIGAALVLMPIAPVGFGVYAAATGLDLNEYKPAGLLLFEARHARPAHSGPIARELLSRMQLGKLDTPTIRRAAEVALELQERDRPGWTEDWGDVFEQAQTAKAVDDDMLKQYRRNSIAISFRVRPRVRAGDPVPIEASVAENRCGSTTTFNVQAYAAKATMNGKRLHRTSEWSRQGGFLARVFGSGASVDDHIPIAHWWVQGSKGAFGFGFGGRQPMKACWDYQVPADTPPGIHEIEVQIRTDVNEVNQGRATIFHPASVKPATRLLTFKTKVEVLSQAAPDTAAAALTPAQIDELTHALNPGTMMIYSQFEGGRRPRMLTLQVTLGVKNLPVPVAHEVYAVIDGKEHPLGQLTSGSASNADSSFQWAYGGDPDSRTFSATLSKFDLSKIKTADLVLRPDPNAALRMVDILPVYTGEIVIRNIALQTQDAFFSGGPTQTDETAQEDESDDSTGD